jgi:2-hydroxychromene-2-carboxylate isomerase
MAGTVDYYLSLNSPWTYMGHQRFADIATAHGLTVSVYPVDFGGIIFPATGGLPVTKRAPQRQAYRLVELERWSRHLGVALNIQPKFWPANEVLAACMVIATAESGGDGAMALAGALLRAVWAEERDIADRDTLHTIAGECGLDGRDLLVAAETEEMAQRRAAESERAIERGVFGAPFYIFEEQPFWGQDRLDMLERAVKRET